MQIIHFALYALGFLAIIPSILLVPISIVLILIGLKKKSFGALKQYLKIWGFSMLALIAIILISTGLNLAIG